MYAFDSQVATALNLAQTEAFQRKHSELGVFHLLWGLIHGHPKKSSFLEEIEKKLSKIPTLDQIQTLDQISPSPALQTWLAMASRQATDEGRQEISERDLWSTLPKGTLSVELPQSLTSSQGKTKELDFLIDLSEKAQKGKLDPVIGRTKEIRAVMEILARRQKNNPILVGPAGVGKTAIVEGLAEQIYRGEVPDLIKGKKVYALDLGALTAGTQYRGSFEEKIKSLLSFWKSLEGQGILFIDEIHMLMGAGKTDGGGMDGANLLKPALARGELACVGATTFEEYRKYILNDTALERRFRMVNVDPPTKEEAIEILMGVRPKHEMHHGIKISDEAVYASVLLSEQYLTDKQLPDKAIDLIDEASAALKVAAESMPADCAQKEADLRNKKILAKLEKNNQQLENEILALEKEVKAAKDAWADQVASLRKISAAKSALGRAQFSLEQAQRNGQYEEASRLKYGVIPQWEKEIALYENNWILSETHIAGIIARQTGISVEKILKKKQESILQLPSYLKSRIFGQDQALDEISRVLVTAYAGLNDEHRPLASFLLMGPTGVGKTETAKALTSFLFEREELMVRFDLSEFSEKHSVAKLIGAPAGYVGYEDGGVLTEAIRRKPYAVLLFDEWEKAHPDFGDILLQILDDGRLTDNKGRVISFRNTIVMLTTNSKDLQRDFKPEVLGRLDACLLYASLDETYTKKLVEKQLTLLNERLRSKNLEIVLAPSLEKSIISKGYDVNFGARPLRSVFQKFVTTPVARKMISEDFEEGRYLLEENPMGETRLTKMS